MNKNHFPKKNKHQLDVKPQKQNDEHTHTKKKMKTESTKGVLYNFGSFHFSRHYEMDAKTLKIRKNTANSYELKWYVCDTQASIR